MVRGGRLLNVVDVEATCWQDAPPPGQHSEITEIGLVVAELAGDVDGDVGGELG